MIVSKRNQRSAAMAALMGDIDAQLAGMRESFAPGERVRATVLSSAGSTVALDVGAKANGVADAALFVADVPAPGDTVDVVFVSEEDGLLRFAPPDAAEEAARASGAALQDAYLAKMPVEGRFEKEVKGGYEVKIGATRAFCPFSQVALFRPREGAPSPVGTTASFLVTEWADEGRTVVVSRRAVEERERDARRATLRASLFEGDTRIGTVTKVMPFGAFVDIGGVEGLVPNSEISWDRSVKPADVLAEGDTVSVKIRRVDWENDRFTFSLKDLSADPWQDYAAGLAEGDRVTGKAAKIMPFGVFVQLVPGVDGLLPISRLGNGRHIVDASEVVKVGDELELRVESVDPVARKISLSLVDKRVDALKPGEIAVGARLKGIVESVRDFGVFVRLSETKTGLLHASETGIERGGVQRAKMEAKFPEGSDVDVVVKALDGDRISLTLPSVLEAAAADERERAEVRAALRENKAASAASGLGSFGALLDAAFGGGEK